MSVASALASGLDATPHLAEQAVRQALEKAGLERAEGVILLLSQHYARHAAMAVMAAARAAGCMQVVGMTAPGLITEQGWVLDQIGAAALVLGDDMGLTPAHDAAEPHLAFCAAPSLPADWLMPPSRIGLLHDASAVWQQARLHEDGRCAFGLRGLALQYRVAPGLKPISDLLTVSNVRGLDILRFGQLSAVDSLRRALPAEWKDCPPPLHQLALLPEGRLDRPAVPLLAINADGSVSLTQLPADGERYAWAMRQPLAAEAELREQLAETPPPSFGLMFSCIGRGPLFYGHDDRDLALWRERYPGVPLLGAYGGAQIAPAGDGGSQQWQNSVALALCYRSQ